MDFEHFTHIENYLILITGYLVHEAVSALIRKKTEHDNILQALIVGLVIGGLTYLTKKEKPK